jgi:signal peptidase I
MSDKKNSAKSRKNESPASGAATADENTAAKPDGTRETIESIIIALILAFLFRTFEAEAFEIPTGSMGPTLMGRNKDVECPKCGFPYEAGVSFEVDDFGRPRHFDQYMLQQYLRPGENGARLRNLVGKPIYAQTTTCPNCRYTCWVDPHQEPSGALPAEHPYSYSGDRIWVSKAPYVVNDPERWDVAVFKYPLGANINYIKRIVGLPNEKVRIHRGNIYTSPRGKSEFAIQSKPAHKVLATLQPVYDTSYSLPELREKGWPQRWQNVAADAAPQWQGNDGGAFSVDATSGQAVLGYRHLPPDAEAWRYLNQGKLPADFVVDPQLITDFCAYNTAADQAAAGEPEPRSLGLHWVGDLSIAGRFDVQSSAGQIALVLIEGGREMQARIDLATGQATLSISGLDDFQPTANTALQGAGVYDLRFANVDDQLHLWVNGDVVEFNAPTTYPELGNHRPTEADLTPAQIRVQGAKVAVEQLRVDRDIYYVATTSRLFTDFQQDPYIFELEPHELAEFHSSPERWDVYNRLARVDFDLAEEQFLALGDNSPNSGDSRFWPGEHFVNRDLIIGKAFYVYWPHAWETAYNIPLHLRGKTIRIPFYPNFGDMRLIR